MPDGHFDPLPDSDGELPDRRGKFIDIETFGLKATTAEIVSGTLGDLDITGDLTLNGGSFKTNPDGVIRVELESNRIAFYDASNVLQGYIHVDAVSGNMRMYSVTGDTFVDMGSVIEMDDVEISTGLELSGVGGAKFSAAAEASNTSDAELRQGFSGGTGNWIELTSHVSTSMSSMSMGFFSDVFRITDGTSVTSGNTLFEVSRTAGWKAWTPTYSNITVGNGAVTARYTQVGALVVARFRFDMGSTSAVGTSPTVSAPVTASATAYDANGSPIGSSFLKEAGASLYPGTCFLASATTIGVNAQAAAAAHLTAAGVTATVPFTWGTSDVLSFTATYEAA